MKLINFDPDVRFPEKPVKKGSKTDITIRCLSRKDGCTLETLSAALSKTGSEVSPQYARAWVAKSFIQTYGYGVRSEVRGNKLRLYIVRRTETADIAATA